MKIAAWSLQNMVERAISKETIRQLFINDIDLLVLSGCWDNIMVQPFFQEVGLKHMAVWTSKEHNGVLIASRSPVSLLSGNQPIPQEHIWLEVHLPKHELKILGIFIPDTTDIQSKKAFMQKFTRYAEENVDAKVIMVGNFSTPADDLGTILNFKRYFQNVSTLGWIDTWRYLHPITYEQTWFSNAKKGLQLDFVILSPSLQERLLNAYHSQIPWDTKHSIQTPRALIVELM